MPLGEWSDADSPGEYEPEHPDPFNLLDDPERGVRLERYAALTARCAERLRQAYEQQATPQQRHALGEVICSEAETILGELIAAGDEDAPGETHSPDSPPSSAARLHDCFTRMSTLAPDCDPESFICVCFAATYAGHGDAMQPLAISLQRQLWEAHDAIVPSDSEALGLYETPDLPGLRAIIDMCCDKGLPFPEGLVKNYTPTRQARWELQAYYHESCLGDTLEAVMSEGYVLSVGDEVDSDTLTEGRRSNRNIRALHHLARELLTASDYSPAFVLKQLPLCLRHVSNPELYYLLADRLLQITNDEDAQPNAAAFPLLLEAAEHIRRRAGFGDAHEGYAAIIDRVVDLWAEVLESATVDDGLFEDRIRQLHWRHKLATYRGGQAASILQLLEVGIEDILGEMAELDERNQAYDIVTGVDESREAVEAYRLRVVQECAERAAQERRYQDAQLFLAMLYVSEPAAWLTTYGHCLSMVRRIEDLQQWPRSPRLLEEHPRLDILFRAREALLLDYNPDDEWDDARGIRLAALQRVALDAASHITTEADMVALEQLLQELFDSAGDMTEIDDPTTLDLARGILASLRQQGKEYISYEYLGFFSEELIVDGNNREAEQAYTYIARCPDKALRLQDIYRLYATIDVALRAEWPSGAI